MTMVWPQKEYKPQVKAYDLVSMKTIIAKSLAEDCKECKLMTPAWSREEPKPQVCLSFSWELQRDLT
jgi:hypothetical protein